MNQEESVQAMREQCQGSMFKGDPTQEAYDAEVEKMDDGVLAGVFSPEGYMVTISQRNRALGDQMVRLGRGHVQTLVHDLGIWLTSTEKNFEEWFAAANERMRIREEKKAQYEAIQKHIAGYLLGTCEVALAELEKDIAPEHKATFGEWRAGFSRRLEEFTNTPTTHKN